MDRRQALAQVAKATVTTSTAANALLDPEQAAAFLWQIKEQTTLGAAMRQEGRGVDSGEINKALTAARIIRGAPENADDGYRAGVTFPTVPYTAVKVRLPWEVTEDVYHGNIAREALEDQLTADMTRQFALDLEDLDLNGDTAAGAGPDQAFLQIDDGILKQLVAAGGATHRIDGGAINGGVIAKEHFIEARRALPNRYAQGLTPVARDGAGNQSGTGLRWIVNPAVVVTWIEEMTNRLTAAGDAALTGNVPGPLGIPFLEVGSLPPDRMLLSNPRNFVRVVTWDVRKRRVTGETDMELAARDKRFYIFFLKRDIIIEELDAVVDVYGLV
jgi:hypothetical protein